MILYLNRFVFLDAIETSDNFYPVLELALVEIFHRCQLSGLLVLRKIWIQVPSTRLTDQVLLLACRLGKLFCTLIKHCKHVLLCRARSVLGGDGVANILLSWRCFSLGTRPISLQIHFPDLYLMTVDSGPFGIFIPVSKPDPMLKCTCSVGLALVQSTVFPLHMARLYTFVVSSSFRACCFYFFSLRTLIWESQVLMSHQVWMFLTALSSSVKAKWQTICFLLCPDSSS